MKNIAIIDIADLMHSIQHDSSDTRRIIADVSSQIKHAISTSGFFYISGLSLPPDMLDNVLSAQRAFFALTPEQKSTIAINRDNRGYLASGMARMHGATTHDQKEVFFWGTDLPENHPHLINRIPLCANNQWPDQIPHFRQSVLNYSAMISTIGNALLRVLAHCLDLNDRFFESRYRDSLLRGQLIRYPQTQGSEENYGVAPHTDFGCLTLLLQQTPGLEVLSAGKWIAAPPIDGTLVVNIGDLLARWSDDRLPSNVHRVRNESPEERYSIAVFHDPNPTASISPADMGSDTRGYTTTTASDYIPGRNNGAFSHYGRISEASVPVKNN